MRLEEILNIKYPFIQGGMAHIATGEFAAAISNAGGLGLIGTGGLSASDLKKQIEICKSKTDKPFGVNILLINPEVEEIAEIVSDYKIPVVTTGAGNPGKYIEKWKESNIKVFPVVSSKALAVRMERLGVDGIIAEGQEAGGHIGELTSMVLIHQIADELSIPVIAAGGIASGKQILAAEVLGAVGVQMGTCLLATNECPVHEKYKDRIIAAKSSQVTVMGRINGLPNRVLKNKMVNEYIEKEKQGATMEELEILTLGSLRKAVHEGDMTNGTIMAGQVVEEVKEKTSVKALFEKLYSDYLLEKKKLCAK
ncbi:nitronate monooxygenase [Anaerosphaera multitolerans]|uniref:Probable nitronate monooxygenase n=1 Tax=Anaerosphaera multitolerans TaxID=2487351 RepID=A0A437S729_9FIRM|nr:nitronate monooxygenase [Anaerosphaera multitolerans]RVU54835.1 enoyl-[acyl-carrier-protein] reductase FabK [Anaerosphaera multitolerans]